MHALPRESRLLLSYPPRADKLATTIGVGGSRSGYEIELNTVTVWFPRTVVSSRNVGSNPRMHSFRPREIATRESSLRRPHL